VDHLQNQMGSTWALAVHPLGRTGPNRKTRAATSERKQSRIASTPWSMDFPERRRKTKFYEKDDFIRDPLKLSCRDQLRCASSDARRADLHWFAKEVSVIDIHRSARASSCLVEEMRQKRVETESYLRR
jgi:hypothetical protein